MYEELAKWAVVEGEVVAHMHYGLRVRVPSGEVGVVDVSLVGLARQDWPPVGERVTVVGADYTRTGPDRKIRRQLRLTMRPEHLREARARQRGRVPAQPTPVEDDRRPAG
ncbi:hypothetical protein GCM10022214_57620 [Actinomadura miaoliensis]|uniref:Uncharacterized protein n=1 Tax=Actinomadura miaoliensis TaxID=430685 RepID=A0ABP7WIM6_9ACTN